MVEKHGPGVRAKALCVGPHEAALSDSLPDPSPEDDAKGHADYARTGERYNPDARLYGRADAGPYAKGYG